MKIFKIVATVFLALLIASVAVVVSVAAQDAQTPAKKQKEVVSIDGDKWKWHGGDDTSIYTITGNVVIKHGDTTVTSDKAEYDEKAKVAVMEGNVKIVDGQNVITGDKATTYLNDRKNVVEGHVKLVGTPKPNSAPKSPNSIGAKLNEPTTVVCDRLEYLYRKKIATVDGNLKITQKDRQLVGSHAVYDLNQELVTLTGGVRVTDEKGQTFTSPGEVKVSLKDGSEWIESGSGSATLKVDIDEETGTEKAPEKGR